ncbi:MAG TPA: hypothetical protein DEA97_06935 [Bacteroidales bacterium]|nr:MAG: hypothetical protein UR43_C0013G0028 [candidate division TM6 bacterium GW2011_GWF2_33_332]OFY78410.1 MAG: hypothetical protein A2281_11990 [Bacteroidetes bacterium RIFOXYA12_FULL_38_20]HBS86272.1 hypothetical protein [Bacteroidales bacterium]
MRSYLSEHKEIVSNLLDGKFIIYPSPLFVVLQQEEYADDYKEFFKESYGYELNIDTEFAYLSSNEVNEKRTRDFVLFLAILCRELDYSGKDFKDTIDLGSFDISETEQLLKQSSKWEILEKTSVSEFEKFIGTWSSKNVLKRTGNQFKFTKAVKLFFEFAVNISNAKLKEENNVFNNI